MDFPHGIPSWNGKSQNTEKMTVYTECEKCGEWTEENEMDYFTGIGDVCPKCRGELIKEKLNHKRSKK